MKQEVLLAHAGARVTARAAGADLAQFAAGGIGFHRAGEDTACAVTALHDGAGGAVAKDQRRLFVLPVDAARSEIRRDDGDTPIRPGVQQPRRHLQRRDKADAAAVDVEARRTRCQPGDLENMRGGARQRLHRYRRGGDQKVNGGCRNGAAGQRVLQRGGGELGPAGVVGGMIAVNDARAFFNVAGRFPVRASSVEEATRLGGNAAPVAMIFRSNSSGERHCVVIIVVD